ncbi:MAG: cbb3-type cytochrome c oxidase subunit 3 [Burkholderiaceae bacterium]|nr:cbb3-type cytochrome c oxidase subunit 3 [Burkholderiaceae bacterium]MEB2350252.1 cbb3-type cytochrome c oxidase subunit 3 [Burkholderiaceae bacterium]
MDINVLRGVIAVVSLAIFLGIIGWAYSRHQKARFDEAANLPFAEKD